MLFIVKQTVLTSERKLSVLIPVFLKYFVFRYRQTFRYLFLPKLLRLIVLNLSNGHSTANLSNSSTRRKFAIFGEFEYSPKSLFRKCDGLARLADICQPGLLGLARLAKAKFCKYYANLASLASLANLASVG